MDLQLADKCALVTGGSRGIGKAIARALAEEGVRVLICSRDLEAAGATASDLSRETGGTVHALAADTRNDAEVAELVASTIDRLGGLDILVNNAARPAVPPEVPGIAGIVSDQFLDELNTKVVGYLRVARAAAPHMVRSGWGRIINIAGLGARTTGNIPNAARNVAVTAMNKGLADELGPKGINCTVVHPGLTGTEGVEAMVAHRAAREGLEPGQVAELVGRQSLTGRLIAPEEVAAVVVFLASPRSTAINGDVIAAGGGQPGSIHY